jgi:hypothetical protein
MLVVTEAKPLPLRGRRLCRLRGGVAPLSSDLPGDVLPRGVRSAERDATNTRGDRPRRSRPPRSLSLVKWFDRLKTALWRVLLRLSVQLYDPSGHAAMDATFFDRENASKHTAGGRITVSRRSKQPRSSTQTAKLSLIFTVRRRNATTRNSAGGSPAAPRATSPASLPTKATIGWSYVTNSAKRV